MSYIALKGKWRVSIAAMLIRAKAIGVIDTKQYQALMKSLSYRKWRTQEPLDDKLAVPSPTLFASAIEVLFEDGELTPQSFMHHLWEFGLAMNSDDVEKLLSLKKGTLKSEIEFTPIIKIKKK